MSGPRFNPNLMSVPLYVAGRSIEEVQQELGLDHVTKLASNESPVGPSPMAVEAARRILETAHRYPGVLERELRRKLAARLGPGLSEHNIVTGNGGSDVLGMITRAFVFDRGNTVMSSVTFPLYRIFTTAFGGCARQIDPAPGLGHDLDALLAAIDEDTRLVFLCSPNNPTGQIIPQQALDAFLAQVPGHVVVVVDESYHDYVDDPRYADSLAYVRQGRNLIVVRSFSKTAGLANLRVGYLVAAQELADYVRRARIPFHTGDVALAAASASLDDEEYRRLHKQTVVQGREFLYREFCALGLHCLPSQANFVLIVDPPGGAAALADALLRRGFIVRVMAAFGMPNAVRVSVGTPHENRAFVDTLREVIGEQ